MDHPCPTRKEHRNLDQSLASTRAIELGENQRSFRQQQQQGYPQVKGGDLGATMAAIHAPAADLKLETSSLPSWASDLTDQMQQQENFNAPRTHHHNYFATSRNPSSCRARDSTPSPSTQQQLQEQQQLDISSIYHRTSNIPRASSLEVLHSHHPKGPGAAAASGLVSIPFSQRESLDMAQLQHQQQHHHHSRPGGGIPSASGYVAFDSALQSITSLVGGSLDQCYNSPREKRQRLSPSFHSPEGLTTIRDTLPTTAAAASRAARGGGVGDEVPHPQASSSSGSTGQSGRNEQGLNEVLQRFTTSPSPATQVHGHCSMGINPVSTPFDSLGLQGVAPAAASSPQFDSPPLLFPGSEAERNSKNLSQTPFEAGPGPAAWPPHHVKSLTSFSMKNSIAATHDASTMEQLLVQCAQALECNDVTTAQQIMFVLGNIAPAEGDPNQRVTACFLKALVRRAGRMIPDFANNSMAASVGGRKSKVVSAVEYAGMIDITPWYRFGFKAANGVMLEAFEGKDKVHIIDFSTTYGMQWPTLIESLSERADGPPHVRLTVHKARPNIPPYLAMADEEVANKLIQFASHRNVDLEVQIVQQEIHQLDRSMFELREDEALVVNCMYRARYVPDESADPPNCWRDTFLRFVHSLDPALVIVVDEEATVTSPNLVARLKAAFNYIWIPFDALDTFLPRDSPQRLEYELDLEKKIENIIACEGAQRIERLEAKEKWGQRMKRAGFEIVPFSEDVNSEVKSMLSDHAAGWGMKHDEDALLLTWKGHNVLFATAWQLQPSFRV